MVCPAAVARTDRPVVTGSGTLAIGGNARPQPARLLPGCGLAEANRDTSHSERGVMSDKRMWPGLIICLIALIGAPALHAQLTYPADAQVKKDGTTLVLEDFADLPLSTPT